MTYGVPIEPMAIAHRGGAALAPEKHIRRLPPGDRIVRYLETDVRTTADGELVCFHDATSIGSPMVAAGSSTTSCGPCAPSGLAARNGSQRWPAFCATDRHESQPMGV